MIKLLAVSAALGASSVAYACNSCDAHKEGAKKECPADCKKKCCAKKECPEGCKKECCAEGKKNKAE